MKKFFKHFSRTINKWLIGRPWRIFALCLPALLGGLFLAIDVIVVFSQHGGGLHRRYDRLVRYCLVTRQFEEARVASLRGLSDANGERDRAKWLFFLALSLQGLGQDQDVPVLVDTAAPLDPPGAGCTEAHLAVAQTLLLSSTNLAPETIRAFKSNATNNAMAWSLRLAERHLLSALVLEPDSVEANELLGRFYINTQQPAKARERLVKIYAAKPDTALLLAIASDLDNDHAGAPQWAERALTAYEHNLVQSAPQYAPEDVQGLVRALGIQQKYSDVKIPAGKTPDYGSVTAGANVAPQENPALWLGIARLLVINGKYEPALETLEHQMLVSSNAEYRPYIGELCALLLQHMSSTAKKSPTDRLRIIQAGLTNAPSNLKLQLLLVMATHATDDSGAAAKTFLDQQMAGATGESAAMWHFIMWTDARIHGDLAAGRRQLQTAHELAPQNSMILNDLAMLDVSSTNRADWENGLKLLQPELEKYANDANLRATRGQLLARLGRNQEALADLDYAVPRLPNAAAERQTLAKVQAALGTVAHASSSDPLRRVRELMGENKYAAALDTLDRAMLATTNPAYAAAEGDICATWVQSLPLNQHADRLRLIQKGLAQAPQQPKLQALLIETSHAADESGLAARKLLDQIVAGASGDSAVQWHLSLGRDARLRGDLATARRHLETAGQLAPRNTQIQIEMAMVLAAGSQDDLARGLQLIQPALDQFPDSAEYRNTRGQILARLGRNKEAAGDLEFAAPRLASPVDSAASRLILAQIYDALGKPKLAQEQRRLAGAPR